ncbi:MAG: hypothetical protein ACK4K2_02105 [Dehalococcoidia bacterium]
MVQEIGVREVLVQLDTRLGRLEEDLRTSRQEAREEMDALREEVLGHIVRLDGKIDALRQEVLGHIVRLDGKIDALSQEMNRSFWRLLAIMLGILIPMWVTIILAVLFGR